MYYLIYPCLFTAQENIEMPKSWDTVQYAIRELSLQSSDLRFTCQSMKDMFQEVCKQILLVRTQLELEKLHDSQRKICFKRYINRLWLVYTQLELEK